MAIGDVSTGALVVFALIRLVLILFVTERIPDDVTAFVLAALAGVVLMVVSGCLSSSDAYDAVSWNVVFLLAVVTDRRGRGALGTLIPARHR